MMMMMMMTTTMMTMNDDDDDDYDDFGGGDGGGGGGNGDDMLHDKTVKDNASSRFLLVHHTCVVSLFSPGVLKLCACLFLDLFHTIYRNTRVLFGSFIITKLSSKCGVFALLFGLILVLK